jgi:hypothetical protein
VLNLTVARTLSSPSSSKINQEDMADSSYAKEATRGEDVEVNAGEEEQTDVNKKSNKTLYDDEDDDEPMTPGAKLKLIIMLTLFTCAILGTIFICWWIFTHVLKRTVIKHSPPPGTPTPAPTVACTKVQEVLYKMGLISSCS